MIDLPLDPYEVLDTKLRAAGLEVSRVGDTFNLERGGGSKSVAVNVDPTPFVESLAPEATVDVLHRRLAGYARGIHHAMLEPEDSEAEDWEFTTAAGDLVASVEVDTFAEGVGAVGGSPAYVDSLADDLVVAYILELDFGLRPLTEEQFERWSATGDRVSSGARSILYHKAQQTDPAEIDGHEVVERLEVGDGYDAARILVIDDLFFNELSDAARFALPTSEHLLFVRDSGDTAVEQLQTAARELYDKAVFPLSSNLFRTDRGRPVPLESE
ncbi:MAG: hypothetical protein ABEL76_00180 [Bradymonadaceae bacterium]